MWMPAEHRTLAAARDIAIRVWASWAEYRAFPDYMALDLTAEEADGFCRWTWAAIETAFEVIDPMRVRPVAIELPLDLLLGGVPFKGFIDLLIEARGADEYGEVEVGDWKTGGKPESGKPWSRKQNDEKLAQPLLYAAALREMGHTPAAASLIHIPPDDRSGFLTALADDRSLDNVVEALRIVWGEILDHCKAGGDGVRPSPSALCGWCGFVTICGEGETEVRIRHAEGRNVGPAHKALGLT